MPAEDFLELLKEWEKLYNLYALGFDDSGFNDSDTVESNISTDSLEEDKVPRGEYEVSSFVDITYGTISKSGKQGLKFKVLQKSCFNTCIVHTTQTQNKTRLFSCISI